MGGGGGDADNTKNNTKLTQKIIFRSFVNRKNKRKRNTVLGAKKEAPALVKTQI